MPHILGVEVDNLTRREAIDHVEQMMRSGGQHIVTTPNPEFIVAARKDREFREILNRAALALPDGIGLVWTARLLGVRFKERIAGSDFVWDLARLAAEKGYGLCLFGGRNQVAQDAEKILKLKYPRLKVTSIECVEKLTIVSFSTQNSKSENIGPAHLELSSVPELSSIQSIRHAAPDIILVALGHGKQEKWIAAHLHELPSVKIAMGVGGALDFIAGRVRRAPRLFRVLGLEWLWRLLRQPWRFPRIWRAVVVFSLLILREKFRRTKIR